MGKILAYFFVHPIHRSPTAGPPFGFPSRQPKLLCTPSSCRSSMPWPHSRVRCRPLIPEAVSVRAAVILKHTLVQDPLVPASAPPLTRPQYGRALHSPSLRGHATTGHLQGSHVHASWSRRSSLAGKSSLSSFPYRLAVGMSSCRDLLCAAAHDPTPPTRHLCRRHYHL
jgi:hypothetical protein